VIRPIAIALLLPLTAIASAHAGDLAPMAARTLPAGGVGYYTVEKDGFRVVSTFASEGSGPVRFVSMLKDGQDVTISVPTSDGPATDLVIARKGDTLTFEGEGTQVAAAE
jgi:hypothetical protein